MEGPRYGGGLLYAPEGGTVKIKDSTTQVKAAEDGLADGQFTAYAATFTAIDSYGDKITKGAFAEDLARWEKSGAPIPLLFGHNMSDPDYNVGHIVEAKEDDHGLWVKAELDMGSPKAAQTYRLLKAKRLTQLSFAYDVLDAGPVTKDGESYFELRKLKLHEVSVVPIGANQETELLAVKTNPKDVRAIPAKSLEAIKAAHDALAVLVPMLKESDDSNVSDEELQEAKAEDRESDKAKEPNEVKARKDPNAALAYLNAVIPTAQP